MSTIIRYLLDDQSADISYLCPVTQQRVQSSFYNNTWTTTSDESCADGWFQLTFSGTGVSVSAPSSKSPVFSATIDGADATVSLAASGYEFIDLEDGKHTLIFASDATVVHPALDYITVIAGQSTSLQGRTIVTDDAEDVFSYTGEWSTDPPFELVFDPSTGPYANTTHWSNTVGDAVSFTFIGDSVAVYGTLPPSASFDTENVTVSYAIDSEAPTEIALPPATLLNQARPKTLLYHASGFSAGPHTLSVNVTSVADGSMPLGIDFMLYNATFSNLDDSSTASPSEWNGALSGSGGVNIGVVVGSVLGGLVAISAIVLLTVVLVRRRTHRRAQDTLYKCKNMPWVAGSKSTLEKY